MGAHLIEKNAAIIQTLHAHIQAGFITVVDVTNGEIAHLLPEQLHHRLDVTRR